MGPYLSHANLHYLVHLKDFIANIRHLSPQPQDMEQLRFYFDHAPEIEELLRFREKANQHLFDQIGTIKDETGWTWVRVNKQAVSLTKHEHFILYVGYSDVYEKRKSFLALWVKGEHATTKWTKLPIGQRQELLAPWVKEQFELSEKVEGQWAEIGVLPLPIESYETIQNFGNFIKPSIDNVINPIVENLQPFLSQK